MIRIKYVKKNCYAHPFSRSAGDENVIDGVFSPLKQHYFGLDEFRLKALALETAAKERKKAMPCSLFIHDLRAIS